MPKTIIVNIFTADLGDITRNDNGTPVIDANASNAKLYLATPDDSGGWMLEVWSEDDTATGPTQQLSSLADIDALTMSVTETLHLIERDVR